MYATVRPRSYLYHTQNIALEEPISRFNAQRNMESLYCIVHYLDGAAIAGLKNVISRLGEEQSLNRRSS